MKTPNIQIKKCMVRTKTVREAKDLIFSRDYARHYGKDNRKVYLIGANYVEDKDERRLEYRIEDIKR